MYANTNEVENDIDKLNNLTNKISAPKKALSQRVCGSFVKPRRKDTLFFDK